MLAEDRPQQQPQPQPAAALRRERGALAAAGLTGGPAELIDFLLPLWAGIALGASATEVGLLVALEMAVSLVARPIAGVLADTRERRTVASAGALLYALSCAGYATAGSISHAYAAAALGGVGGAFLWVALRAIVSERLQEDTAVYPRLMSATETGTWVAFVCGFTLLDLIDFEGLFAGCALACLVAAVWLLASPPRELALAGAGAGAAGVGAAGVGVAGVGVAGVGVGVAGAGAAGVGAADRGAAGADAAGADAAGVATAGGRGGALGAVGRRLRPMLLAVAFTMAAEAAVGLLLLLHLQRGFELEVVEIAFVFLPGAIAMSLLPERIHRLVLRFGRARVLAAGSIASGCFALTLAWAPNPVAIAGLWVLSGLAWAAVMPIQQAVIAEASGERVGRGMGLYESAALAGGFVGSLGAGLLYDAASWQGACVVAAAVIASGAVIVPRSVRLLGVADVPVERGADVGEECRSGGDIHPQNATPAADARDGQAPGGSPAPEPAPPRPPATTGSRLRDLRSHALLYLVAQVSLVLVGSSWLFDLASGDGSLLNGGGGEGLDGVLTGVGRVWTIVLAGDALWTLAVVARARARARRER